MLSDRVSVPLATGLTERAIVLPETLVREFAREQLEPIVIHELAHLRRYDVWTNLLARLMETIGSINPATWYVMRQLSIEREIACDDWVVARTGTGSVLARTLAALANVTDARVPIAAPSALGSRHAIVARIERLLDTRPRRLTYSRPILGGTLVIIALFAVLMQSFMPVLAFAAPQPSGGPRSCPKPDRGIELMYLYGMERNAKNTPPMNAELVASSALRSRPGRPLNLVYEVTVDAFGRLVRSRVIDAPKVLGMKAHFERLLAASTYAPALRNCVPLAQTIRTAAHVGTPEAHSSTVIAPLYAAGWSARNGSTCKIPTVTHARFRPGFVAPTPFSTMMPEFPDSERSIGVDKTYATTIRVRVNGSTATRAIVTEASGRAGFDAAALAAARRASYPLTSTTCKIVPTDYLWKSTFAYQVIP